MDNVDMTIEAICIWIQEKLKDDRSKVDNFNEVSEMTKALAGLVSARERRFVCFAQEQKNKVDRNTERRCEKMDKSKLEKLTKPLIEYLKENCHPYTSIVITGERVAVMETALSIPADCID